MPNPRKWQTVWNELTDLLDSFGDSAEGAHVTQAQQRRLRELIVELEHVDRTVRNWHAHEC